MSEQSGVEKAIQDTTNHMHQSIRGSLELMEHLKTKLSENDFKLIASELQVAYLSGYTRRNDEQKELHARIAVELKGFREQLEEGLERMLEKDNAS